MFNVKKNILIKETCEYVLLIILLLFAMNFLTPVSFEPSGESFNEWAAAKMLFDGYGFPVSHIPLAYSIYSGALITLLNYPAFVVIEFYATFLFFFLAMYLCCKEIINKFISIIICIAFMPAIIVVEGHNTIFACSIFFIYIRNLFLYKSPKFLSLTLLFCTLFHQVFLPFFIGHSLGYLILNRKKIFFRNIKTSIIKNIKSINLLRLIIILMIIITYIISLNFQSSRKDNNYFMSEYTWAPIKLKSPVEIGVFQIAPYFNSAILHDNKVIENEDWYFLAPKVLNGSKNLLEVFYKAPLVLLENALINLKNLAYMPNTMILQLQAKPIVIISLIIFILSVFRSCLWMIQKKMYCSLTCIVLGVTTTLSVLLLTWTHNFRYNVVFFPIILPFVLHTFKNFKNSYINKKHLLNILVFLIISCSLAYSFDRKIVYNGLNFNSFKGAKGFAYNFQQIQNHIKTNDIILTPYQMWIKAFYDVNPDQVIPFTELPPFSDNILSAEILNKVTQIWISKEMLRPMIPVGYDLSKRYKLHISKFLKENEHTVVDIGNLGKIYKIIR